MRVEFGEYGRHGLLHEGVDIDGIYILVIDDVEQVVQLVGARVDDTQAVASEVVGIERADEDTDDGTHCQP